MPRVVHGHAARGGVAALPGSSTLAGRGSDQVDPDFHRQDLGWQPFDQGAGRVDAYAAATASFAVVPTRLAYGRIDAHSPSWSRRDTLHLSNLTPQARTVVFPPTTTLVIGATLTVTPATVTLPPNGAATAIADFVVDNALAPTPTFKPYGYTTTLIATSGTEAHRIPVSFHEAATLAVPTRVRQLILHNRGGGFLIPSRRSSMVQRLPSAGTMTSWRDPPVPPYTEPPHRSRERDHRRRHRAAAGFEDAPSG